MIRPALFALLALSFSACDATPAKDVPREAPAIREVAFAHGIDVLHDDARGVTCWAWGNGISCLPDSALARDGGAP